MSLLREIQMAATDGNVAVATVLRKAKILATRLGNRAFEEWVKHELNGYKVDAELPAYRLIPVTVQAHLRFGYQHFTAAQVMTSHLPEELKHWGHVCRLFQPIAEITAMSNADKNTEFQFNWPQEMAVKFGSKGYNNAECLGAWQVFSANVLVGVIDTVRNRLLEFALQIERENPDAGEAPPDSQPVAPDRIQPLVQTIILGNVGNLAQSSNCVNQTSTMAADLDEIRKLLALFEKHLGELDLDARQQRRVEAQLATLRTELAGESDATIVQQAVRTLRNLTEGAIASLVATAVQPTIWLWIHTVLAHFN